MQRPRLIIISTSLLRNRQVSLRFINLSPPFLYEKPMRGPLELDAGDIGITAAYAGRRAVRLTAGSECAIDSWLDEIQRALEMCLIRLVLKRQEKAKNG